MIGEDIDESAVIEACRQKRVDRLQDRRQRDGARRRRVGSPGREGSILDLQTTQELLDEPSCANPLESLHDNEMAGTVTMALQFTSQLVQSTELVSPPHEEGRLCMMKDGHDVVWELHSLVERTR